MSQAKGEKGNTMELNKALSMVRGLVSRAEHPETPPAEAQACRERADAMMLKYAIDEAMAEQAKPVIDRGKPTSALFPTARAGDDGNLLGYVEWLLETVARHTRCLVRGYVEYDREQGCYLSRVYGWESDVRYFEILYTTLRLHMLGVLRPKPDASVSLEENAYRLHDVGYNWLEIAALYGWRKRTKPWDVREAREAGKLDPKAYAQWESDKAEFWYNQGEDKWLTNWQVGGIFKRAYYSACKKRGEEPKRIPAGGSETYRRSALQGYVGRIGIRLRETQKARAAGSGELVLASRAQDLEDYYRECSPKHYHRCPACKKLSVSKYDCDRCGFHMEDVPERPECEKCKAAKSGHCRAHRPHAASYRQQSFSQDAYSAGVRHANTADLSSGDKMGSGSRKQID